MRKWYCLFIVLSLFTANLQAVPVHLDKTVDQVIECLYPENDLERAVVSSEEWLEGARWGVPRKGHPEGAVIYHIHEVLGNVESKYGDSPMRETLRFIAIVHDTFKYKVDETREKEGENEHGMIARRFAEKYISDAGILEIIQRHDEAYFAWCCGMRGDWEVAYEHAADLIDILGDNLDLFIAFYECDNATGDKTPYDVVWFKDCAKLHLSKVFAEQTKGS